MPLSERRLDKDVLRKHWQKALGNALAEWKDAERLDPRGLLLGRRLFALALWGIALSAYQSNGINSPSVLGLALVMALIVFGPWFLQKFLIGFRTLYYRWPGNKIWFDLFAFLIAAVIVVSIIESRRYNVVLASAITSAAAGVSSYVISRNGACLCMPYAVAGAVCCAGFYANQYAQDDH